jgi:hypothetical protein
MEAPTAEVITTAVAPIVMVSAAGLLVLGIQTKNLHLADRVRQLTQELRGAPGGATARRQAIDAQLVLFERRVRLTHRSLELLYVSIFCFVATALALAAAPWVARSTAGVPVIAGLFTLGIVLLLLAIVLEFLEMRAGLTTIRLEIGSATAPARRDPP